MDTQPVTSEFLLTSTQKGSVGEAIVGAQLMLASAGRLSPFRPVADDDGTDLLVVDKHSGRISKVQVKARYAGRSAPPATVQFDVRRITFSPAVGNWLLAVLIDPMDGAAWATWMIPSELLEGLAVLRADKLVLRPSPATSSKDRYSAWRGTMADVVRALQVDAPVAETSMTPARGQ